MKPQCGASPSPRCGMFHPLPSVDGTGKPGRRRRPVTDVQFGCIDAPVAVQA